MGVFLGRQSCANLCLESSPESAVTVWVSQVLIPFVDPATVSRVLKMLFQGPVAVSRVADTLSGGDGKCSEEVEQGMGGGRKLTTRASSNESLRTPGRTASARRGQQDGT